MGTTEDVMAGIERARARAAAAGEYVQPVMTAPRDQWDPVNTTEVALLAAFDAAREDYAATVESDVAFGDWSDPAMGRAYAAAIRQARAWRVHDGRIAANAPRDGLAGALLDRAAGKAQEGGWVMPDTAEITEYDGRTAGFNYA